MYSERMREWSEELLRSYNSLDVLFRNKPKHIQQGLIDQIVQQIVLRKAQLEEISQQEISERDLEEQATKLLKQPDLKKLPSELFVTTKNALRDYNSGVIYFPARVKN